MGWRRKGRKRWGEGGKIGECFKEKERSKWVIKVEGGSNRIEEMEWSKC